MGKKREREGGESKSDSLGLRETEEERDGKEERGVGEGVESKSGQPGLKWITQMTQKHSFLELQLPPPLPPLPPPQQDPPRQGNCLN